VKFSVQVYKKMNLKITHIILNVFNNYKHKPSDGANFCNCGWKL